MIHHGSILDEIDKVANRVTVVFFVQLYYYKLIASCFCIQIVSFFLLFLLGVLNQIWTVHTAHANIKTNSNLWIDTTVFFVFTFSTVLVEHNRSKFGRVCPAFRKVIQNIELHIVCSFKCDNNRKGKKIWLKLFHLSTGILLVCVCVCFFCVSFPIPFSF